MTSAPLEGVDPELPAEVQTDAARRVDVPLLVVDELLERALRRHAQLYGEDGAARAFADELLVQLVDQVHMHYPRARAFTPQLLEKVRGAWFSRTSSNRSHTKSESPPQI